MMYFLILTIPFIGAMTYLVIHNKQIAATYLELIDRLKAFNQEYNCFDKLPEEKFQVEIIVTYVNIKDFELVLDSIENQLNMPNSKFISNTFTPRKKQLAFISKKFDKIEKEIVKVSEEETLA